MGSGTFITQQDKQITVDVPPDRLPEFYAFFARFLAAGEAGGRRRGGRRGGRGRGFGAGGPGPYGRHCHHGRAEAGAHEPEAPAAGGDAPAVA